MADLKLGRLKPPADEKTVKLSPHLNAAAVPASADFYSGITYLGMMLNDSLGDCTCAGDGHIVEQQTALGDKQELKVPDSEVLKAYEHSGYKPGNPNTDQGWTVQAALDYLRTDGMRGQNMVTGAITTWKIAAYGELNVKDHNEVKQAVYEFGCLSIGFDVPESAMQQFQEGQPWTVVNGSPIEGGHCVIVVGYDADYVYVVTWGAVQKMAWAFWDTYVDQAFAVISKDWQSNSGLDLTAFGAEFSAMFGGGNPFDPAPSPSIWRRIINLF